MLVKFSTLAGGVFIEQKGDKPEYEATDRCFRNTRHGSGIEWAYYADCVRDGERARFYGSIYKASDFIFA